MRSSKAEGREGVEKFRSILVAKSPKRRLMLPTDSELREEEGSLMRHGKIRMIPRGAQGVSVVRDVARLATRHGRDEVSESAEMPPA
mmetsp:Transcript_61920/g.110085  ORF Transcript_61920/g.110085 Transcript_61920/m.110085 type:complete len:87 (-) Transcript_61920:7-267(-)